jgi:hypothetical protein
MRKIVLFSILLFILLSCNKARTNRDITENNISITDMINEVIEIEEFHDIEFAYDSRDMFYYFFSDIKNNYFDYDNTYIIIKDSPHKDNYLLPEERYIVKNDDIEIHYYPSYFLLPSVQKKYIVDGFIPEYMPFEVILNKHSKKYYLGKYIGRNIDEAFSDFDNTYNILRRDINDVIYVFSNGWGDIRFITYNNIVTTIIYSYYL